MAFLLHPDAPPLPGDVRQRDDGSFERYDIAGWSADTLAFQGEWCEWEAYRSGDVVSNLRDLGGLWVCLCPDSDRWTCIALPAGEATP
jgi:hypothetical protein